jgi:hypothetical protein
LASSYKSHITQLKRTKTQLNEDERSQTLFQLRCIGALLAHYQVALTHVEEDVTLLVANLKSLLTFESQRHLVQEVGQPAAIEGSKKIVRDYVASSMPVMREDLVFFREVKRVLNGMPLGEYAHRAFEMLLSEWTELEERPGKDTSSRLQDKCRALFMLAHLRGAEGLRLIELLLIRLDCLDH